LLSACQNINSNSFPLFKQKPSVLTEARREDHKWTGCIVDPV